MTSITRTKSSRDLWWPILGCLAAIGVTTTMDANDLSIFSALPLLPLMALFWILQGFDRREVGFVLGSGRDYLPAVLYPLIVLGAATAIAWAGGAIDTRETDWGNFWLNLVVGGLSTILVVAVTEEGFFRGWLWASLGRAGAGEGKILMWTSAAFSLWHLSGVALDTGFDLPAPQIPILLVNAFLLGLIWAMLRLASGSVLVASVSHGLWNGLNYALFAFGTKIGALGVEQTSVYGPEVGWVGILLNGAFAAGLWRWLERTRGGHLVSPR